MMELTLTDDQIKTACKAAEDNAIVGMESYVIQVPEFVKTALRVLRTIGVEITFPTISEVIEGVSLSNLPVWLKMLITAGLRWLEDNVEIAMELLPSA